MNTSSSTTSSNAYQNPQIIRISTYPRAVIDRKPDDQSLESLQRSNYLLCPPPQNSSSMSTSSLSPTAVSSATVPQIVNILNPLLPALAGSIPNSTSNFVNGNGGIHPNAKKCTFHRQCLHVQPTGHQQQQQQIQQQLNNLQQQQQQQQYQQNPQVQQQLLHPQIIQQQQTQQQVRISNQIPAVNRNSTQANRDAISSNVQPQFNAALLQDRYLLLDMVDGSSFYKCIDIQTQKVLACKVIFTSFIYIIIVLLFVDYLRFSRV